MAELAQAAGGRVSGVQWAAVRYSISGDPSVHDDLQSCLFGYALRLSRRDCWPAKVAGLDGRPKFYRDELAALVLDEDAHRRYFAAAPLLYAAYMEVSPLAWDQHLEGPFAALKAKYSSWIAMALSGIRRGIRGD